MSYSTLQKDLEHITLKKDLDQALERMVEFEEEVNRKNEESESEEEEFEEEDEDIEFEFEDDDEDIERLYNFTQVVKGYIFGIFVGVSFAVIHPYINGRSKNNKR